MKARKRSVKKIAISDRIVRIVLGVIMASLSLSYVFMYLWLLLNSFRTSGDFLGNSFRIFDFKNFTPNNYLDKEYGLFNVQIAGSRRNPVYLSDAIVNTVILVLGQVILHVTIPAITAYIIAKYDFKIRKFILDLAIVTMVIPTVGSLPVLYRFMTDLNLTNRYLGIFLMSSGGLGFGFLLFRNFFAAIPWDYAESAFLDGASDWTVFIKIMYPQAVPIISAIAITSFISCWNDYFTAYIYLPEKPTISLGVNQLYTKMRNKNMLPVAFAGMTVLSTVSLAVFAVFNKSIMNNMSAGGIKG